jgi:hypothetical protein
VTACRIRRREIEATIERVLARPRIIGALHLWIHLWESTDTPERAEGSGSFPAHARRQPHRPHAHAYLSASGGRRRSASICLQRKRTRTTSRSAARRHITRLLPAQPALHLDGCDGQRAEGSRHESAYRLANAIPGGAASVPILQGFIVVPYWTMVRFGEWDRILSDNGPRHGSFTLAAWRCARAMALTARPARRGRAGTGHAQDPGR